MGRLRHSTEANRIREQMSQETDLGLWTYFAIRLINLENAIEEEIVLRYSEKSGLPIERGWKGIGIRKEINIGLKGFDGIDNMTIHPTLYKTLILLDRNTPYITAYYGNYYTLTNVEQWSENGYMNYICVSRSLNLP